MRKSKKAAKRPSSKADKPIRKRSETSRGVRAGSKLETIVGLLKRPGGCTRKQVMEAVDWPSVSLNQQAAAAGLKLTVKKIGGVKVYSAVPSKASQAVAA